MAAMRAWPGALAVGGLVATAGCGDGLGGAPADAAQGRTDAAGLEPASRGLVEVLAWAELDRDRTGAMVRAEFGRVRPPSQYEEDRMTEVARAGACRLLRRLPGPCQATCDWACFPDGTCQYDRDLLDAGAVTITGAGPDPIGTAFPYVAVSLPALAAPIGATIEVTAAGAAVPAFTLAAARPPALDLDVVAGVVRLRDDVPTVLRWTAAPDPAARYALRVGTPHGHAGTSEYVLACDGVDTGEVVIDPALAAALPPLMVPSCVGLSCRPAALRRSVDVAVTHGAGTGATTLRVGEVAWFWVDHPAPTP